MLVIGDDEKRRQRAQTPGALRVAGAGDVHHGLLKFDAVTVWRVSRVQAQSQPALSVSLYG